VGASRRAGGEILPALSNGKTCPAVLIYIQGCSPKKEVGGRLKQDLDNDLSLT